MYQRIETSEGRIVTGSYRILATLYAVPGVGIPDLLNRNDRPFVPLGDPHLYDPGGTAPGEEELRAESQFLALPKTEIWWLAGGNPGKTSGGAIEERALGILYGDYLLRGRIRISGHVRTSDFIAQRVSQGRPFDTLLVADLCRLERDVPMARLPVLEAFEHVTVNLARNMGIFDLTQSEEPEAAPFTLEDETGELT